MKYSNYIVMVILGLSTFLIQSVAHDPIDVVIPAHEKDVKSLNLAIQAIKKYGQHVRRVIVVSTKKLTDQAEWFDEARYPFTQEDILLILFNHDQQKVKHYLEKATNRAGWIYQQLLKLYALCVIPDISSNVLVLDADTIFLRPVSFIDEQGYALYNVGSEYEQTYFEHGARLLPDFKRVFPEHSGVCHHMLFQRSVIEDFFRAIQNAHDTEPWIALSACVDPAKLFESPLSEYELYFNFVFASSYKVKIRKLTWIDIKFTRDFMSKFNKEEYDYVACHERSIQMPHNTDADFDQSMETTTHYQPDFCKHNWLWRRIRQLYNIYFLKFPEYSETPRIPKIIHQIWLGSPLPEKYKELQASWIKHHPDWQYILWTDEDVEALGLENKKLYDATTNWGKKSDIARLEILDRFGGLYVDTDFECRRPFDVFHHCCDFYAGLNCGPTVLILNGLMGAAPGHSVIKRALEKLKENEGVTDNYMTIMYGTGPGLITEAFKEITPTSKNRTIIFPSTYFYPWPYYMRDEKDKSAVESWVKPETFGVHYWHLSWNDGKIG